MHLRMTVVSRCYTVCRTRIFDLLIFQFPVCASCFRQTRLEKAAAAAATVIVRHIRSHIDKVLFTHNRLDNKPQIFGNRIPETLAHELARILNSEFHLQILVPVRIDLELSFPDPLRIILNDALDLKIVGYIEFFQSDPDCEKFVPSLRIEPDLALQIIHSLRLDFDDVFP